MSERAAKIMAFMILAFVAIATWYGFVLGLIAAVIVCITIAEALAEIGLLPPKDPPQ